MTPEQRQKVLEKLAYSFAEVCKANGVTNSNDYNWRRANDIYYSELEINGENWLLSLIKEK